MSNAIKTKKFLKWLKENGLICMRDNGSHQVWNYADNPLDRPVVVKVNLEDMPKDHITTNLKTLGIPKKTLLKELQKI